ncbi:hypothetical protein BCR36DRAFT_415276 [Piromyces finnis]|uniref:Uncharacterized protein n=1 Tax=Piromyces finnis TaxID=1754191 RepID=A0A1Y1V0I6_9FUNG|nr:hypothetical protein BCR36DRAFT_415276 [Piromyces finnis]|eukprot:ORX43910.1 hypothetical protein BCR36DRAFT_415276 [Piromyces finnis]
MKEKFGFLDKCIFYPFLTKKISVIIFTLLLAICNAIVDAIFNLYISERKKVGEFAVSFMFLYFSIYHLILIYGVIRKKQGILKNFKKWFKFIVFIQVGISIFFSGVFTIISFMNIDNEEHINKIYFFGGLILCFIYNFVIFEFYFSTCYFIDGILENIE